MERDHRVQEAIPGQAARVDVDAEPAGKEEVGLTGFHCDAGGDGATVEVPGTHPDIVLGENPSTCHRVRLALNGEDAVNEHEGLVGQTNSGRVLVDGGVGLTQDLGDRADGELQARFAIEQDRLGGRRHRCHRRRHRWRQGRSGSGLARSRSPPGRDVHQLLC